MHLARLIIKGFKSFAEQACLEFEPGVTAIVGPNGSGKSNIVDAIAWVLGTQGPRSLRGGRMEDVIYQGSDGRPPLGRAEVTLVLDNSDHSLPVDLAEVSITRTLFRGSESEYAICGRPCRLLDIQELLSDAGIGKTQHVIVGQGQLDAVLEARPEERRAQIEEAAGILKYKKRRQMAFQRLEAVEADLERALDVAAEQKRRLRPLERQASAEAKRARLAEELEQLKTAQMAFLLSQTAAEIQALRENLERLEAEEQQAQALLERRDPSSEEALEEARLACSSAERALARAQRLEERATRLVSGIQAAQRRLHSWIQIHQMTDQHGQWQERLEVLAAEIAALESQALELAGREAALRAEETQLKKELATCEDEISALESRRASIEPDRAELEILLERREHMASALRELAAQAASASKRHSQLEETIGRLDQELASLDEEEERAKASLACSLRNEATSREFAVLAEECLQLGEEASRKADLRAAAAQSRLEALAEALRSETAEAALEGLPGVLGRVSDLVEAAPGWEEPLAAALGEAQDAWVVEDSSTLLRLESEMAQQLRDDRVRLIACDLLACASPPGAGPRQPSSRQEWAQGPEELTRALLGEVEVVSGLEEAIRAQKATAGPTKVRVTRSGERVDGALVSFGNRLRVQRKKLEEAREEAERASAEAGRAKELLSQWRGRLEGALGRLRAASQETDRARQSLAKAEEARRRALAKRETCSTETHMLERALAELAVRQEELRASLEETNLAIEQAEAAREARRGEVEALEEVLGRARKTNRALLDKKDALGALRRELEANLAALEERRHGLIARRAELETQAGLAAARAAEARSKAALGGQARSLLELSLERSRRLAAKAEHIRRKARELVNRAKSNEEACSRSAEKFRSELAKAIATTSRLREERSSLEARLAELQATRLLCRHGLQLGPGDPDPEHAAEPPPDSEARIAQIEAELGRIGPTNQLASLELAQLTEELARIEAQIDDVRRTRAELIKLLEAIDEETESRYEMALADIAKTFSDLMSVLFPGGGGKLRAVAVGGLAGGGVEIEASPAAGTRMRSLSLLSGGERSLVALAFSFALYMARPSPFYVLDEVEAALDDINLGRFLGLVSELREDSQLIVVTHQRRTMEQADYLYGVTMEKGTSKVVGERIRRERLAS